MTYDRIELVTFIMLPPNQSPIERLMNIDATPTPYGLEYVDAKSGKLVLVPWAMVKFAARTPEKKQAK